jgi:hypothetical protein
MHGDDVTAGGGCGAHCAVRQGSSGNADSATGKFLGSREQPSIPARVVSTQRAATRAGGWKISRHATAVPKRIVGEGDFVRGLQHLAMLSERAAQWGHTQ